ncbi:uncharacterized protein LOC131326844 [Rhododendron vialii]|uniref:uncharacterized protein LOC131326844 n=1 Tax=Rhododendron vialii TaxID=182163 RepID=UPI00265EE194|nr:uncharacterized protein LOC131326844 [Rhododendron vialii]
MADKQNEKGSDSNDALGSTNDPFFIPHSDSPTAVLVTPLLSGDNYGTWLRAMTMALRAKNKLGFVDGSIEMPNDTSKLRQWERCNDLVSSWILNSTEIEIRGSILYAETAREVWLDLRDRFTQTNAPKVYQLKQAIGKTTQEDSSVSTYFTKMKALWDELSSVSTVQPCTCGHGKANAALHQQDRAMEFLQGLHERYSSLRSQILLMEPFPSAAKIYALVRQEEKQQEIHSSTPSVTMPEAAALTANSVSTNGKENWSAPSQNRANVSANFRGHHPNRSSNRYDVNSNQRNIGGDHRQTGKPRMHCDYCDRDNHNRDTCYRLHGYPTDKPRSSSNNRRLSSSSRI